MFIREDSPQVKKRLIQACAAIYRSALKWISSSAEITDDMESAWNAMCMIKAQILDLVDNDNDGIRTNAIKFLEGIILLQTYADEDSMKRENDFSLDDIPLTVKIARRRKLEDEALNIFDLLLKFHGASHISSVNLIACMGTLCTVAKMRPSLMGGVVDAIKSLHMNLPPTLTDSQVNSVKKTMRLQLLNILKLPSAFDFQTNIITVLTELGVSNSEIARAIPRLDKAEQMRRTKRALENASAAHAAKKAKLEVKPVDAPLAPVVPDRLMEIDTDEIAEQKKQSTRINEKFIMDNLKTADLVVQLVIATMTHLPSECPESFMTAYHPIANLSIPNQTKKIAELLAEQMTEKKVGPGASVITRDPPMRPKVSLEEENSIIQSAKVSTLEEGEPDAEMKDDDEMVVEEDSEERKDDATKKLRETLERVKGEQMIPKMKQRVKTLKLQEVTKPLSKNVKDQFLQDSINRILNSEKQCIIGGVASKRRKILTVIAATFSTNVRDMILNFITDDLKTRIDLAFSWLYEEYSLFQGFTRHSYIKTEHKPDYAYNQLLNKIIQKTLTIPDPKDREKLLKKIYLEAPIISDDALQHLIAMCELLELCNCGMSLLKDLTLHRPPKQEKFINALLKYSVHDNSEIREKAIENVLTIYTDHKIRMKQIEDFTLVWLQYVEQSDPPADIFSVDYGRPEKTMLWSEDLIKSCLSLFLALMPLKEVFIHNLSCVYANSNADMKRVILKSIELPIRNMGPNNEEILKLIENCPKGGETLITRIVYILTEKSEPTQMLVSKVRDLYQNKVPDVRLLIPVLSGLTRKEILAALPKLLKLNPVVVKEVFNRLLNLSVDSNTSPMPLSATELLVALHTIDSKCELKFIVKATSLCLAEKDTYTHDILAIVLQQLVEMSPLPTLLMRTVIQSLTLYPRLANFVTNLLQRLISKQVWKQKVVWDGFLKCCQRLQPQSYSILIQLPPPQLQDALVLCPELKQPLLDHANVMNQNQIGHVSDQTMSILKGKKIQNDMDFEEAPVISDNLVSVPKDVLDETKLLPPGEE